MEVPWPKAFPPSVPEPTGGCGAEPFVIKKIVKVLEIVEHYGISSGCLRVSRLQFVHARSMGHWKGHTYQSTQNYTCTVYQWNPMSSCTPLSLFILLSSHKRITIARYTVSVVKDEWGKGDNPCKNVQVYTQLKDQVLCTSAVFLYF